MADLLKTGRFDQTLQQMLDQGNADEHIAWSMTDYLVRHAQEIFLPVWTATRGNDGYVGSAGPIAGRPQLGQPHDQRVARYVTLGKQWAAGQTNRMIKVPATPAGLVAIEELAAAGVTLNVTLVFTRRQYLAARDAIWRGEKRHGRVEMFKSVYSIFVSRVDVYTEQHVPQLSRRTRHGWHRRSQADLGRDREFWADKRLPLSQEIVFASTGTKKPADSPWKYVAAFAGSDIETNPPATNEAVEKGGLTFTRQIDALPPTEVLDGIAAKVDQQHLETTLMSEGIKKFADPQKALLDTIAQKRTRWSAAARQHINPVQSGLRPCPSLTFPPSATRRVVCRSSFRAFFGQCLFGEQIMKVAVFLVGSLLAAAASAAAAIVLCTPALWDTCVASDRQPSRRACPPQPACTCY